MSAHDGALEAVDRILNRGGAAEVVLRDVATVLHDRVFAWVAVVLLEPGGPRRGPEAGTQAGERSLCAPVLWQGSLIGEIHAEPREPDAADAALLERVATLVSPQVLDAR